MKPILARREARGAAILVDGLDLIHAVRGTAEKELDRVRCFEPVEISAMGTASHDVDYANQHENEQPDHADPFLRGPFVSH
jgi:hypothetical protein